MTYKQNIDGTYSGYCLILFPAHSQYYSLLIQSENVNSRSNENFMKIWDSVCTRFNSFLKMIDFPIA